MKKQIEFPELENIRLDDKIRKTMQSEFFLPTQAEEAKNAAFEQIRNRQLKQEQANTIAKASMLKQKQKGRSRRTFFRTCAGTAAAAAIFSAVCITNPTFAAQVPLVGHVFEEIGQSLGFSGDFSKFARPLDSMEAGESGEEPAANSSNTESADMDHAGAGEAGQNTDSTDAAAETSGNTLYSRTANGMTVTLSEVYCNDVALYVSMVLKTEDKFPETMQRNEDGGPLIDILRSTIKFSYNDQELILGAYLDGKMMDEYTFAGVLRYDLAYSEDNTDYDAFYEKVNEFYRDLGISQEELDNWTEETHEKICELLGTDVLSDEAVAQAGGPDISDYTSHTEIPDSFSVTLSIPQIVGYKADPEPAPEMPEDLRAEYEQAMAENGLGLTQEDYEGFTEEQMEIERKLYTKMMSAYSERYPDSFGHPNKYENWWVDGPWEFTFDVTKDDSQTIVKEINDVDENGIGLVSVTKTPFELTVEDGNNYDCFTVVLDADGDPMPYGNSGGSANVMALQDRDVSRVDIYVCDYVEYMDELKGYYWSDDYEEKKKTKTFKELLDERALYHREITFEE